MQFGNGFVGNAAADFPATTPATHNNANIAADYIQLIK
jgi:hypothetical protein